MAYKIIALDLDGTLTNSEKKITEPTKEALLRIQKQGIKVAIASGRPTPGTKYVAETLELERFGNYVLSFNGARIFYDNSGELDDIYSKITTLEDEKVDATTVQNMIEKYSESAMAIVEF